MKSFLARASGAALGFIADNTRGARLGYRMGKYAAGPRAKSYKKKYVAAKKSRVAAKPGAKRKRGIVRTSRSVRRKYLKGSSPRKGRGSRSSQLAKTGGSYFRLGSGPKLFPGFKRTQQPTTFTSTSTQRITGVSATQAVRLLPTWQINPGVNAEDTLWRSDIWVDGILLERAERWLAAYALAPAANVVAGTQTPFRIGARATMKFVVNYVKYDQMFRNMSTQDAEITLYDCVLRNNVTPNHRPGGINPIKDWESGLTNERNPSRQTDAAIADPSALVRSPGTTPFMSSAFCKLYRIAKVTKKTLSAGEVHHHSVTIRPRQMFDAQTGSASISNDDGQNQDSDLNTRGFYLPGTTGFTILVANGSIMGRRVADAPTANDVTFGQVAIDCVTKATGSFSSYTRERRQHLTFDGLTKGIPNTELAGPQDDAGVIQVGDPIS
ncbi:capsid protein [Red panda feces-associated circular DNA virus 12]|uniref:Capsid protein n=1 Tax=Red panda feces-associated circular DNA virus 12 TaxID=2863965 RepID=A0A8K1HID7_9VIRU|nr:capsid protein [Red panda feces-associated circular DNA virus 12]